MKRLTQILSATVLLGGTLLISGCQKNGFFGKGGEIVFGTVSGEVATRTQYGADYTDSGSATFQFINWQEGDVLTVVSAEAVVAYDESFEHVANYAVTGVTNDDPSAGHQSNATVSAVTNGLCWKEGYTGTYNFYGVYPAPGAGAVTAISYPEAGDATDDDTNVGIVSASLPSAPVLPSETGTKTVTDGSKTLTYTVYEPDMAYAVMTGAATGVTENANTPQVSIHFQPAFTAFELNMTSKDTDIEITQVQLVSQGSDYLAGPYTLKAGDLGSVSPGAVADLSQTVTLNTKTGEDGITVGETTGATFTLFTLPKDNTAALKLRVTILDNGVERTEFVYFTRALRAGEFFTDDPYIFQAGQKYRINLLKLDSGTWKYAITLIPELLPWDYTEDEISFTQTIQSGPFTISNATEEGDNFYPAGKMDYQVRTLDMSKNYGTTEIDGVTVPNKPYFEVTFIPMAPVGGYWQLIPEGNGGLGTAAFKVEVWDKDDDSGTPDLKGQIMQKTVTLHITSNVTDEQRTEDHAIILKGFFSTSISFDESSTFSADSELQDAHRDGSFSYWRFVIPKKNN